MKADGGRELLLTPDPPIRGIRLIAAGAGALALHVSIYIAVSWMQISVPITLDETPIALLDLSPALQTQPAPQPVNADPETPEDPALTTPPTSPETAPEGPAQLEPAPTESKVEAPTEAAIAQMQPPPPSPEKKPEVQPKPRETAKLAPRHAASAQARDQTGPPRAVATASGPSPEAMASWRGQLMAALLAAARRASTTGGDRGIANIALVLDRAGAILSADLAGTSGNPSVDNTALQAVRNAGRLPPPPIDMPGSRFTLNVPVRVSPR